MMEIMLGTQDPEEPWEGCVASKLSGVLNGPRHTPGIPLFKVAEKGPPPSQDFRGPRPV